jgi:hypothetical protein
MYSIVFIVTILYTMWNFCFYYEIGYDPLRMLQTAPKHIVVTNTITICALFMCTLLVNK